MPISFTLNPEMGYFTSKYSGELTDEDLIRFWRDFLESDGWSPSLNELADLSDADLAKVTTMGVKRLAEYTNSVYKQHGITSVKVAVYAPTDLAYGMTRVYGVFSEGTPEGVCVFRYRQEAEDWLTE